MQDIHRVNLLKSAALSFNNEEIDNSDSHEETSGKDVTVSEVDITNDEWCEEGEKEVPAPVGCCRQGHSVRSVAGWIHFCTDSPL